MPFLDFELFVSFLATAAAFAAEKSTTNGEARVVSYRDNSSNIAISMGITESNEPMLSPK